MSETLYRKYRPKIFAEVIGQKHIVQTLTNAIKNNRIGHSYLFTGPRGTGKTTVARLFAKAVNCKKKNKSFEPCLKCDICKNISEGKLLDIIEIDAASNTGVDNIRELRETVNLPPTQGKYKVYIIDEVHMLSQGAFNALLKTLEEPPSHVLFILATTEIHKVPETIISRCQRFDFSRIPLESIAKKLSEVSKNEGVEIEKDALEMIAIAAEGGMRDAESLLSQVISLEDKKITSAEVKEILGTADHLLIENISESLLSKNTSKSLKIIAEVVEGGYDLEIFNKSLLNYLRQLLLISIDKSLSETFSFELTGEQVEKINTISANYNTKDILRIIDTFSEIQGKIKSSFIPQLPLEMAAVEVAQEISSNNLDKEIHKESITSDKREAKEVIKNTKSEEKEAPKNEEELHTPEEKINTKLDLSDIRSNWEKLLVEIRPYNHSLNLLLSNCQPTKFDKNRLTIATKYSFYTEKLSEAENKLTIEKVLDKILGEKIIISFISEEEAGISIPKSEVKKEKPGKNGNILDEAMKVMGGKIVEEE